MGVRKYSNQATRDLLEVKEYTYLEVVSQKGNDKRLFRVRCSRVLDLRCS